MVDDINFQRGLPPVSASSRIQKVNRKKREEEKAPFEKFLKPDEQKDKKKKKRKKESDKVNVAGKTEKDDRRIFIESESVTGALETEDNSDKKVIDVRV